MAGLNDFLLLCRLSDPLPQTILGFVVQNTILTREFLGLVPNSSLLIVRASVWVLSAVKIVVDSLVADFHGLSK
jgi:hypothetical protein